VNLSLEDAGGSDKWQEDGVRDLREFRFVSDLTLQEVVKGYTKVDYPF
jgi:hypothetical protein